MYVTSCNVMRIQMLLISYHSAIEVFILNNNNNKVLHNIFGAYPNRGS